MARNLDDAFFKEILENLNEGVYIVDPDRRILFWNRAAEEITGFSKDEVVGMRCWDDILMHVDAAGENLCTSECPLAKTIRDGTPRQMEIFLYHKYGHRVPVVVKTAPLKDDAGEIIGAVEAFHDNLAKFALQAKIEELEKISLLDPLTQLANKRLLVMNLVSRQEEFKRFGWPFGILFVSIDKMKETRNRYGRMDEIIQMAGRTLSRNARAYDMVGVWGRRFMLIIKNVDEVMLHSIAEKFRMLIAQSGLRGGDEVIRITVSIGGTCATRGDEVHTILRRANEAVRRCREAGGNRVSIIAGPAKPA